MTSKEVKSLLQRKFSAPAFAYFTEVANGTGAYGNRYIDAVAYSLYPSQGNEIIGMEVKVNRSDWLNELKNLQKSDDCMVFCNRWYLVAPAGVASKDELPKNWGYYEIKNDKIFTKKMAPFMENEISLPFIAALLRRATENSIPGNLLWERVEEQKKIIYKQFEERIKNKEDNYNKLQEKINDFEKASGINILSWHGSKKIGEAANFVLSGGLSINYSVDSLIDQTNDIKEKLENFKKLAALFPKFKE